MDSSAEIEVSSHFSRGSTKSLTEARVTPVILVCIYNKNNTLITHDQLYNVFSACGKILRILIFEKVKVWKAFVEFSSTEEAVEAKRNLNEFILLNDGTKMNIYFSNLDTVKFQNNNAGGIDYTQTQENNLADFQTEVQHQDVQHAGFPQLETSGSFQNLGSNPLSNYESFQERSMPPTNIQNQPHSNQNKWSDNEADDEAFLKYLNEQNQEKEPAIFQPEAINYQTGPKDTFEDFDQKFLEAVWPSQKSQQMNFEKAKQQTLNLQSPAFISPAMQTYQNPIQNSNYLWPQNLPNVGPPGLSLNSNQGNMQEPIYFNDPQSKLVRMPNSFPHIPLHNNNSPHNTPPLSQNSTFNELPTLNPRNSGLGLLPPKHQTYTELPKTLPKTSLTHSGSMNHLPAPKPSGHNPSSFSSFGGMNQGGGMNQPGLNQGEHFKRPGLNPRIISTPELYKGKVNPLVNQNIQELLGKDVLLRLLSGLGLQEGADLPQSNSVPMDLNEIKNSDLIYKVLEGKLDYNDLSKLSKEALDQVYHYLSTILHKDVENKENAVLYVKGLEDRGIKVNMLYNIFSNFGNITKIVFVRRKSAALIEYENVEYATKAKDYLNNIVFMGKPLRISYSLHQIINLNLNLNSKKGGKESNEEIFLGTNNTFRFKKGKTLSLNPPSSTLHISNLVKEVCTEDIMRNTFSPYGRIEALQFKFMDFKKNMCLIRMASMEESLNAMANLHNVELGGRPIQISFTKSKI